MIPARYVLVLLCTALLSGVVAYAGGWTIKVAGCRVQDVRNSYLAYCDTPSFGSYEHEAYALDFEPAAVRAMQRAQVLFLGNSKLQFAFSTPQTDRFFQSIGASYHLLGFGYGESSAFIRYLFDKYRPRPQVVIINADPFFQPVFSPAAWEMFRRKQGAWVDAALKRAFGRVKPWVCEMLRACSDDVPVTYRDWETGQWIWQGLLMPQDAVAGSITSEKSVPWQETAVAGWARDGETFLRDLHVARSCVILVGVPNPQVDSQRMATELGRILDVPVIRLDLDGLATADGSHLSAASAERWSAAFFAAAEPVIRRCVSGPAATSAR